MNRKLVYVALMSAILVASAALADSVGVGDFEGNLDGWRAGDGFALSFSATGATTGAQALQVDGPGDWHISALLDAKSQRTTLAMKGVKITADVTVVADEMTTAWMQVGMVINAQGDELNGVNNNVGWNDLGSQDVARDGQPHTYTWVLPDALTAKIAKADDNIGWFELALISNLDVASVAKFYVDNIQISYEGPTSSVLVSSFEGGNDGWYTDTYTAGTIAVGTTGATAGAQALQVEGPGGWQQLTKVDVRPHLATLATKGVKITADLTAFEADMATTWMQVGMVINAQNNDDSGANNNLGWNDLGSLDIARDGQPHTYTWAISDAVAAKIAGADSGIGWFEILLISNADETSVVKFYIDNIQLVSPAIDTDKSTDTVIGNWEQQMDGWVVGGGADVLYNDVNGVTLDSYSLDVWVPSGAWNTDVLKLNLMDPNQAAVLEAFKVNTKVSADVTRLVADWPVDDIPGWNEMVLVLNAGGDGWSMWEVVGKVASWRQPDGDKMITAVWDYAPLVSRLDFDNLTYCELNLGINANDATYEGTVWFYIDNMRLSGAGIALDPLPANGAVDVDINTMLNWTGGIFAASHNVYLGTSTAPVEGANLDSNPQVVFTQVDTNRFDPNELAFNTRYFWRVDEVNEANPDSPWKGPVWNFTTANFITVDDFESYTDNLDAGEAIFNTWTDGWKIDENGSLVGYEVSPFAERTNVRGGFQAMPLLYDNTEAAYSATTRQWAGPQDWTRNGFDTLKIYIMGKTDNVADEMYITIEDEAGNSATMTQTDTSFMTAEAYSEWFIPIREFAGVDVTKVVKFTVGVGNRVTASGATGMLFIDDIRVVLEPYGLVAHYALENNLEDSSGNGFHGTFAGDPNFPAVFVNGPAGFGKGLLFDGTGGHQNVECGTFNPSAATGQLTVALWAKWDGLSNQWQGLMGKRDSWNAANTMWHLEVDQNAGTLGFAQPNAGVYPGTKLPIGTWAHVAVTFDGTTGVFYLNGVEAGRGAFSFGFDKDAAVHFGSDDPNGGNAFNGALDEVRLYDKALSAAEVQALLTK